MCRYCCKSPRIPGVKFFERNEAHYDSLINMAPRPLAKPPVSLSRGDEVPHIFIRESHQWAIKIFVSSGKRLLQQNLPQAVLSRCNKTRYANLVGRPLPIIAEAHGERLAGDAVSKRLREGQGGAALERLRHGRLIRRALHVRCVPRLKCDPRLSE